MQKQVPGMYTGLTQWQLSSTGEGNRYAFDERSMYAYKRPCKERIS